MDLFISMTKMIVLIQNIFYFRAVNYNMEDKRQLRPQTNIAVSPRQSNPLMSELFSPEFLSNINQQLHSKLKSPNSLNGTNSRFSQIANQYKKQILELRNKIKQLTAENLLLKNSLSSIPSHIEGVDQRAIGQLQTISKDHKLSLMTLQHISINSKDAGEQTHKEQLLRNKITNLQNYKEMKEKRFKQMVARETTHLQQIAVLKSKNQELYKSIHQMQNKKAYISTATQFESEQEYQRQQQNYFDQQYKQNLMHSINQSNIQIFLNQQLPDNQQIIQESQTIKVILSPQQDFYAQKAIYNLNQSNQIDQILAQQLPYASNTDIQQNSPQQPVKQNLNQSLIGIVM